MEPVDSVQVECSTFQRYQMEVGPKNAVLIVKKAEKSDEGPYKVQLENEHGSNSADTKVNVLSKYTEPICRLSTRPSWQNIQFFIARFANALVSCSEQRIVSNLYCKT